MPESSAPPVNPTASPPPERRPAQGQIDFPVIGVGASAGGLDAYRALLNALPDPMGMAFILIQHLDPTHESMMVDLLTGNTWMTVVQAADGMMLERDHIYVIPPGTYLSVGGATLHLSVPLARHGARLPFDFLLHSIALSCGANAACVVLSGTGADGSLGLKSVQGAGGLVIAQSPDEATFDGMPRNAIATGLVDLVLPTAAIPAALLARARRPLARPAAPAIPDPTADPLTAEPVDRLPEIIELLHTSTGHDFRLYKPGTLGRRVERRMSMAAGGAATMAAYLERLRGDANEREALAADLLINVTGFFRDADVFRLLAEDVIPDLVANQSLDRPLRIWVAGCSSGEEIYSLTVLFLEAIAAVGSKVRLQVFGSDADADAIATARDGVYPRSSVTDISPARLARFFTAEGEGYRVTAEMRAVVVFTVQDLLVDPPFSRLDLVSCRNLLIYLRPEAQARAIARFHFALRKDGYLLLGTAETIGDADDRFALLSKSARLYRHLGRTHPGDPAFSVLGAPGDMPPAGVARTIVAASRQTALAELCRRLVIEAYAPAAVLINRKHQCIYSLGPTERYLRVAPGHPSQDVLAMALQNLRGRLRSAVLEAQQKNARIRMPGGLIQRDGQDVAFTIDVQPVRSGGEDLLLICFVEGTAQPVRTGRAEAMPAETGALEHELEATRAELHAAIHDLEISGEDQRAVNDEASSLNEELQSTNEELLTSKEELQSLNEELVALNSQLHETLGRQRTTANDMQNVLYSTKVATIFLDTDLKIRLFTPAASTQFRIIPTDIGRPLADLSSLTADSRLLADAREVLLYGAPVEREIEARTGTWFLRHILPYRTDNDAIDGVVITFVDITERRHAAAALGAAKREAELASVAKSRFLAAASHDLRQPLQTLALLLGLLGKKVEGDSAHKLVARLDETLGVMSGMLNTLLDITQIDAGTVTAEKADFPVNDLLARLKSEFTDQAQARGLALRVVGCGASLYSDQRLLEQMLRNIVSNALKYTEHGKVLIGCRRRRGVLRLEVWDTGIGIPEGELVTIFEEYHQLDNDARERNRGLGLGLSIVQRLGKLLGHRVRVRSRPGKGSVFSIEVALPRRAAGVRPAIQPGAVAAGGAVGEVTPVGAILIVEDDPEVRELLELLLKGDGHHTTIATDGVAALALLAQGMIRPDVILADYNLPKGVTGLEFVAQVRAKLKRPVPAIILTGDISSETQRRVTEANCVQLNKPMKPKELSQAIWRLLPPEAVRAHAPHAESSGPGAGAICVIDDDHGVCEAIRAVFEEEGWPVETFPTGEAFLETYQPGRGACLLIDASLPGMSGLDLLARLTEVGHRPPAIMITGNGDVAMAVHAIQAGAMDFIEKPIGRGELLASVERAIEQSRDASKLALWQEEAAAHIASLTPRQREIMDMVLAGHPSKNIAADLGISQRTVENHRAAIMDRTGAKSLPALARLALVATPRG